LSRMTRIEAKWLERVREWKDSGLTAEEFVEGKQYRASTLVRRSWQQKRNPKLKVATVGLETVEETSHRSGRKQTRSGSASRRPSMRSLPIAKVVRRAATMQSAAPTPEGPGIVVEIGLARIKLAAGFDLALLKDVVRALQGAA
jgi:hypothetical protein